jgi:hypothetical protein
MQLCPAEPKWLAALWLTLALLAALMPVWISSTLPTSDGGSHVYNAMVAAQVRAGNAPFDSRFVLRKFPRSNFASDSTLRLLGPLLGWENAERVLASLTLLLSFLPFYLITRTGLNSAYASATSAWLASNWFFWMGFYDFSLSLAVFAALVIALRASQDRLRWAGIAVSLLALYATHLFTFAAGTALFIWFLLWRVARGQTRPLALATAALPVGLLAYELLTGPVASGGISWGGWRAFGRAFAGWAIGDFLITFTWTGLVAGAALMLATWAGLLGRLAGAIRSRRWDPIDLFAMAAFAASLAVPDHIGAGLYTAARIRFITVILLLPSTVGFLSAGFLAASRFATARRITYAVPAALLLGLAVQCVWIVRISHRVTGQVAAMERALVSAGVGKGDWVTSPLLNRRAEQVRITIYAHLPERAYLRLGACGLDNYEAGLGNFEVQWRRRPDELTAGLSGYGWSVAREPREMPWEGGLWVLHDASLKLVSEDPALHAMASPLSAPYRVTPLQVR